jgi:pilus assembly protein Flp/PilA
MLLLLTMLQAKVADRFAAMKDDETGATAVEYGIMVALIAAVIIAIVVTLGEQINDAFTTVSNELP